MTSVTVTPSPRKKPRKQQHVHVREHDWNETEAVNNTEMRRKLPNRQSDQAAAETSSAAAGEGEVIIRNKPQMSLINSYRHTWKSRHNHFLR